MEVEELKKKAAGKAVEYVDDGMVLGLGTGSTTKYAIESIGGLVKEGYDLVGIPTSIESRDLAKKCGIKIVDINDYDTIDLTIDGTDEVDPELDLIKGLGGALVREKIVASCSKREIIIGDDRKVVDILGTKAPLPVEVVKYGCERTLEKLRSLGCEPQLRISASSPFVSDNGNYIVDCGFDKIDNKIEAERDINNTVGVVENGLFLGIATKAIIAYPDKIEVLDRR